MFRNLLILAALVIIVALPFVFRQEQEIGACERSTVTALHQSAIVLEAKVMNDAVMQTLNALSQHPVHCFILYAQVGKIRNNGMRHGVRRVFV